MMKRTLFGLLASVVVAGTAIAAQGNQGGGQAPASPPAAGQQPTVTVQTPAQKPAEISITGCLVQGSTPTVFILENAKVSATSTDKPQSWVLEVAPGTKIEFQPELNHQVTIMGIAENRAGATVVVGQKVAEKDMLKFTARTIVKVADTCPAAS
jgi:hypothetical protein